MYRPTVEDMTFTRNFQQLSCAEGGKFDHIRKLSTHVTGWGRICKDRAKAGVSRRARIRARS